MGTLNEDRLEAAVRPLDLGTGEKIMVVTKMGSEVISGDVLSRTEQGVSLRLENGGSGFYSSALYGFVPDGEVVEPEPPWPISTELSELPSDRRVRMSEEGTRDGRGAERGGEEDEAENGDDDGDDDNGDDSDGGKRPKKRKDDGTVPEDDPKVDASTLPQDIKDRVLGVDGLDEEQVNKVLIDVNDAAMKALRRVGVNEQDIYAAVGDIQNAVLSVLEKRAAKKTKKKR